MKLVYSPRYAIDIGPHVYLTEKYRRIHARLLAAPHAHLDGTIEPEPATWNQLALVHFPHPAGPDGGDDLIRPEVPSGF